MLRVGLTGGIASGKSTVLAMFCELGAGIVDTDLIARDVVAPGQPGLDSIRDTFGPQFLTARGELDRAAMRRHVFADPSARARLEALLHPLIRRETLRQLDALETPYALVAVPLLIETGFRTLVDRVLVVDCPEVVQLARLEARDRIPPREARSMLLAQASRAARLAAADDVIDNSLDLEHARAQVLALHERYLALTKVCPAPQARAE